MKNSKQKRFNFRESLSIPYGVFMILFVVFPLLLIFYYAFTDDQGSLTFENWKTMFSSLENWKVIGMTFFVSTMTTLFCVLIAYPIAFLLSNAKYNKNKILVFIFLLPMWINFVIRTIGVKAILNGITQSIFGYNITAIHPYTSIIIGMVYDYLPFALLPLYNQMLKLDKSQIEAAADLGANRVQVFTKAIIPMTIPGIVSACMMTFMPTMSSYVIANKMSESTKKIMGNLIEFYFIKKTDSTSNNVGSVLSLVMLMIIGISLIIEKLLSKNSSEDNRKLGIW